MDKNYCAKRYFIFGFKRYITNESKMLAKKYTPSIRELLFDYIDIYEDINKNRELIKLENARDDTLKSLNFFIRDNIFFEMDIYKQELRTLTKEIEFKTKDEVQYTKIYNICKSLIKKFNQHNIYSHLVNLVKTSKSFGEIDKAIESIISELLYDGYSLKYIDEWYNKNIPYKKINEEEIDEVINEFEKLKKKKEIYIYYLSISNKDDSINGNIFLDYNLQLTKQRFEELSLVDNESGEECKSFLQHGIDNDIYSIEIKAMDMYKGLEIIEDAFESYFQIVNYLISDDKKNIKLNNKAVIKLPDETYSKVRIDQYDEKILFSSIESRERQDTVDFKIYRDKAYSSSIKLEEISNMQRAINIVKSQKDQLKENRLINLWAVLEYILTFHEGSNIISKVTDIVPKIVCLYYIKDKLNVFWNKAYHYDNDVIKELKEKCTKEGNEYLYDLEKLISYIEEKGQALIKDFEFNDTLKRDIAEIGKLITDGKHRRECVLNKHEAIKYDLIRIYRARNNMVHAGKKTVNIDYKSLRLYQYNNSLLGVIIHYKKKNPYSTITEILNSIDYTYDKYLEILKEDKSPKIDVCKPKYLFID